MHSQLALTEHVSLNLAPLILLDPVYPSFRLRGQVDSQCKSCLVTDNFPQQICQGNIKTERNNRITLMHIQEMGSSQFGGVNIETVHAKLNIDIRICELKLEDAKPSKRE